MNHLLTLFGVPKSTFYERVQRGMAASDKYADVRAKIAHISEGSREGAGQRTIQTLLKGEAVNVSRYVIRKIMRQDNLHSKQRPPETL